MRLGGEPAFCCAAKGAGPNGTCRNRHGVRRHFDILVNQELALQPCRQKRQTQALVNRCISYKSKKVDLSKPAYVGVLDLPREIALGALEGRHAHGATNRLVMTCRRSADLESEAMMDGPTPRSMAATSGISRSSVLAQPLVLKVPQVASGVHSTNSNFPTNSGCSHRLA
jgi:hypothetical protein